MEHSLVFIPTTLLDLMCCSVRIPLAAVCQTSTSTQTAQIWPSLCLRLHPKQQVRSL